MENRWYIDLSYALVMYSFWALSFRKTALLRTYLYWWGSDHRSICPRPTLDAVVDKIAESAAVDISSSPPDASIATATQKSIPAVVHPHILHKQSHSGYLCSLNQIASPTPTVVILRKPPAIWESRGAMARAKPGELLAHLPLGMKLGDLNLNPNLLRALLLALSHVDEGDEGV